jgi:hypothetical protein
MEHLAAPPFATPHTATPLSRDEASSVTKPRSFHISLITTVSPAGDYLYRYRHSIASRQCYAEAHGYTHVVDLQQYPQPVKTERYDWSWGKIHGAVNRMESMLARRRKEAWAGGNETRAPVIEWLFLIDVDFAIQRFATPLEHFFDPLGPYDVLVSDNLSGEINMGFAAFRVGAIALAVLRRLQSMEAQCVGGYWIMEQNAFNLQLALMMQEHLCGDAAAMTATGSLLLPRDHAACQVNLLDDIWTKRATDGHLACWNPSDIYISFGKLLPPELWSYGHRNVLPWLHAYKYTGDDATSALVDFNRFDQHSAAHNPLSTRTDWASHAKENQGSYLALVGDMDAIGASEPFCKALYYARP